MTPDEFDRLVQKRDAEDRIELIIGCALIFAVAVFAVFAIWMRLTDAG